MTTNSASLLHRPHTLTHRHTHTHTDTDTQTQTHTHTHSHMHIHAHALCVKGPVQMFAEVGLYSEKQEEERRF